MAEVLCLARYLHASPTVSPHPEVAKAGSSTFPIQSGTRICSDRTFFDLGHIERKGNAPVEWSCIYPVSCIRIDFFPEEHVLAMPAVHGQTLGKIRLPETPKCQTGARYELPFGCFVFSIIS